MKKVLPILGLIFGLIFTIDAIAALCCNPINYAGFIIYGTLAGLCLYKSLKSDIFKSPLIANSPSLKPKEPYTEVEILNLLSEKQQNFFLMEMNTQRKKHGTALLLGLFLGGIGAHHYYLGNVAAGILYTCFFWTFIPGCIAFIELFLMKGYVDEYNQRLAQNLAVKYIQVSSQEQPISAIS